MSCVGGGLCRLGGSNISPMAQNSLSPWGAEWMCQKGVEAACEIWKQFESMRREWESVRDEDEERARVGTRQNGRERRGRERWKGEKRRVGTCD